MEFWTSKLSSKIHIVLDHLDQFVKRKGALGPYSEQASESVHADWIKTWDFYKSYPGEDRLLKCVLKYNKKHIKNLFVICDRINVNLVIYQKNIEVVNYKKIEKNVKLLKNL